MALVFYPGLARLDVSYRSLSHGAFWRSGSCSGPSGTSTPGSQNRTAWRGRLKRPASTILAPGLTLAVPSARATPGPLGPCHAERDPPPVPLASFRCAEPQPGGPHGPQGGGSAAVFSRWTSGRHGERRPVHPPKAAHLPPVARLPGKPVWEITGPPNSDLPAVPKRFAGSPERTSNPSGHRTRPRGPSGTAPGPARL